MIVDGVAWMVWPRGSAPPGRGPHTDDLFGNNTRQKMLDHYQPPLVKQNLPSALHHRFLPTESFNLPLISF
jgi:hypothetical protein